MAVEFHTSLNRAKKFGLIGNSHTPKSKDGVSVEINSIEEKRDKVIIDFNTSISGKTFKQGKLSYKKDNLTNEEATFLGLAFVLTLEENDNFFSDTKLSESKKQKLKDNAKKFLEMATKEDFRKRNKESCLPYYLIAKHRLYDYKDNAKTNLHKSLSCPDVFPDVYNVLINLEGYSIKKMLLAQEGLKKFPTEESLITEIADYYIAHNEHKKAIDLILDKKKAIVKDDWINFKSLRLLLFFSLIKLERYEEARKEIGIPICEDDFEKDANLFLKGFIEYESENYKGAKNFFLDTIKISTYNSSEARASFYFLLGCYNNLGEISQLEELIKEFELASDYFHIEALRGFNYVENVRKTLKDILKSDVNELAKAKVSGLLAFSYFQELETNQQSIKNRAYWGSDLTKKEKERIKKNISLVEDTLKHYPRVAFFNALCANLHNYIKDYDNAVKFDLKAIDGKEDESMDGYSYTSLDECSEEFIDNYVNIIKENLLSVEAYVKERLGSDVEKLKELKRHDIISESYYFLKKQIGLDKITNLEEDSYQKFLFDIAYNLKEYGDSKEAKNVYEKYIKAEGEDPSVLNNLAIIYEEEGNKKQATILIKRAKKLSSDDDIVDRNYARLVSSSKKEKDSHRSSKTNEKSNKKIKPEFNSGNGQVIMNKNICQIPLGTIEYYICNFLFQKPFGERITEGDILEEWDRMKGKQENSRTVYDAHRRINSKIKTGLGITKLIDYGNASVWIRKELFEEG